MNIVSRNPATDEILREIPATPADELAAIFSRAQAAQVRWSATTTRERTRILLQLRETLLNHADEVTELISKENGKPPFEAMTAEVLPSLEFLTYFAKRGPRLLKDHPIRLNLMKHRVSYLNYWPLGTVLIISPWNYPFLLPFADLVMALVAGNTVVFKPSEVTPLIGLKIQELCDEAGLPTNVLQTVIGDGSLGSALIRQKPAKIFFTGSVGTGKKVMAAASEFLIPVNLELGGKDPMIVLPDADLDYATSAALWGGYSNSGQVCASVERLLVHEKIAEPFLAKLKEKVLSLRQNPQEMQSTDLGAITSEKQKEIYEIQLEQAKAGGATLIAGGQFSNNRRSLMPTIVSGPTVETLDVYNEETFGPVVAVTTFKSIAEAIEKANKNRYGLVASVICKDIAQGEAVARQLEAGTVIVNEVTYTAGLPETPWGGLKESGFGRTHSDAGLYEFVNVRHVHKPKARFFVFKSLWWFPYTPFQYALFRSFMETYRRSWLDKLRAIPTVLWNLAQLIKHEKRL